MNSTNCSCIAIFAVLAILVSVFGLVPTAALLIIMWIGAGIVGMFLE